MFVIIITMLFRDATTGNMILIKRQSYHCNTDYYHAICNVLQIDFPKSINDHDKILKLINSKTK